MILQTNTFICECEKFDCKDSPEIVSVTEVASIYDDPVINLPSNWNYYDGDIVCPMCMAKLNQEA